MAYGAIDLHSTQSQVRLVTDAGEIVDRRIPTTRDHGLPGGQEWCVVVRLHHGAERLVNTHNRKSAIWIS